MPSMIQFPVLKFCIWKFIWRGECNSASMCISQIFFASTGPVIELKQSDTPPIQLLIPSQALAFIMQTILLMPEGTPEVFIPTYVLQCIFRMITLQMARTLFALTFFGAFTDLQMALFAALPGPLTSLYNQTLVGHYGIHVSPTL